MRLFVLMASLALGGCEGEPTHGMDAQDVLGGLRVHLAGGADGSGRGGGPVVVLLHGYGGSWSNMATVAGATEAPAGTRWVFPEAPLPHRGGRAWWKLDLVALRARFERGEPSLRSRPAGLAGARRAVLRLLGELERRLGAPPSRVVLGGFSQGAMLTCDVALQADRPLAGVALLSGMLVAEDESAPLVRRRRGLPVLVTHGRQDDVLPIAAGERIRDRLSAGGLDVRWAPFGGGHDVSPRAIERLGAFLHEVLAP